MLDPTTHAFACEKLHGSNQQLNKSTCIICSLLPTFHRLPKQTQERCETRGRKGALNLTQQKDAIVALANTAITPKRAEETI